MKDDDAKNDRQRNSVIVYLQVWQQALAKSDRNVHDRIDTFVMF